jgi:phenylacetate-CoA ligase
MQSNYSCDPAVEFLNRDALAELQARKLRALLERVAPTNRFWARKLAEAGIRPEEIRSLDDLRRLPLTTRAELTADQAAHPPYGTNLTLEPSRALRLFQTSGTSSGRPLRWLYDREAWEWVLHCWAIIYRAMGLGPEDRLFYPFSFGPFLGFWAAFEGATRLGNLCLPGGGMSTGARLKFLIDNAATVICCTPTYALRLAETAREDGIDLAASPVRALIVAGEPGGNIPAVRERMERDWGARCFDHSGMTEIGSLGFECWENPGALHLIESECVAEVIDPKTGEPLDGDQAEGELVLSNLGQTMSPLLRYRTGDLVRLSRTPCPCGRWFARLEGGILGRADDMVIVKGNNLYPGALEGLIRRFAEIIEYRAFARVRLDGTSLRLEVEPASDCPPAQAAAKISAAIRDAFHFRADVAAVEPGTLPRFELKAKRFFIEKE